MGKHMACELLHNKLCLEVEVTHHIVGAQPTNEANGIVVNLDVEEGHGTSCMEVVGGDFWLV
jgi:hypothetical protein